MRPLAILSVVFAVLVVPGIPHAADDASANKEQLISKAEATRRAQQFFDKEIALEGALGKPTAKSSYWVFPVKLGYAGTVQRDPLLVNRRTGEVSWAGLSEHKAMLQRDAKEAPK
jgi:hypothetical protein